MCLPLSGCAFISLLSNLADRAANAETLNAIQDNVISSSQYAMTMKTKQAGDKAEELAAKAREAESKAMNMSSIPLIGSYFKRKSATAVAEASKANYIFEQAKSKDTVYQQSVAKAAEAAEAKNKETIKTVLTIVGAVALLLILAILLIAVKKRKSPAVVTPEVATSKQLGSVKTTADFVVDYNRLLIESCAHAGIDTSTVLQIIPDVRTAYEKVNLLVARGYSGADIISKLR